MATRRALFHVALGIAAASALAAGLFGRPGEAQAAFRVAPIRVDLDQSSRSGAITVTNDSAQPLTLQMKAVEWTQDADGTDRYVETSELVFFPKVVTLGASGVQVIRVGTKSPPAARERCFRLYIDQLPAPRRAEEATVSFLISLGVPVFVRPAGERAATALTEATVSGGGLRVLVRNTGNEHFKIEKIAVRGIDEAGAEVYAQELAGRYLHGGSSRRFDVPIPADICPRMAKVRVSVKTDRSVFEGDTPLGAGSCLP